MTEKGIRVGDTLADVDAAYGDASETIDNSERFWRHGPTEVGLPGMLTDMRMVASGDRALVFLAEDGAIRYILVTPLGSDGKLEHLQGC